MLTNSIGISPAAAIMAFAGPSVFLILVFLLHFIEPEFDPSWRFLSEYSLGSYGWVMKLAFFTLALGCIALFVAIRSQVTTRGGKVGAVLLLVVAASLVMAGIFDQDPVTAKPNQLTGHGTLHAIASTLGLPGLPIAAVLISRSLAYHVPAWARFGRSLRLTAHLTWISIVVMMVYVISVIPRTGFVEGVITGWMNRLVMLIYCLWLMTTAWFAIRLSRMRNETT